MRLDGGVDSCLFCVSEVPQTLLAGSYLGAPPAGT